METIEKTRLEMLIESNTPFAVVQYYDFMKMFMGEDYKVYELITIRHSGRYQGSKEIGFYKGEILDGSDIDVLKVLEESGVIVKAMQNQNGNVYEYGSFGKIKDRMAIRSKDFIHQDEEELETENK